MWWHEHWLEILLFILAIPVIGVVLFARWMSRRPNLELEQAVNCWDVFVKLISALTVIVSGSMLFGKYIEQQAQSEAVRVANQEKELNLRKAEFLRQKLVFDTEHHQRQRKLFDEVKTLAARIANADSPDPASRARFEELYYADLIGVEKLHGPVESAMVRFRNKLKEEEDAPSEDLPQLALDLSKACETELRESQDALLKQHEAISDLVQQSTDTN